MFQKIDSNFKIIIQESEFEDVSLIWSLYLWPNRETEILPYNIFFRDGSKASNFIGNSFFFEAISGDEIVGVISFHKCPEGYIRLRGLCVLPDFRNLGVGKALVKYAISKALSVGPNLVWTAPRLSAWPFYEKLNFERISEWQNEGFEFGPNCFAQLRQPSAY